MHALNFRRIAPIEAISDFVDRVGLGEVEGYRRVAPYGNIPSVTDTVLRVVSTSHSGLDVTAGIMGYLKPIGSA